MKFKGEEGFALFGLIAGLAAALLFIVLRETGTKFPMGAEIAVGVTVLVLFIMSMAIKFSSIFTHHAVLTVNSDDFILGLALGFDIPLVGLEIVGGHLPFVN